MSLATRMNKFQWAFRNASAPNTPGTSVTPGTSNAKGSWVQIAASSDITEDVYEILLRIHSGGTANTVKIHILDIGYDPAGGTSWNVLVPDWSCGTSTTNVAEVGVFGRFPIRIPAGSAVAVRIAGSSGTAGTVLVGAEFYGKPSDPTLVWSGTYAEKVGTITSGAGVSITPGTNAYGSYVTIGTTAKACAYWLLSVHFNNANSNELAFWFDLAYGSAGTKVPLIERQLWTTVSTNERASLPLNSPAQGWGWVDAGTTLYARAFCGGTPGTGFSVTAIGIGA